MEAAPDSIRSSSIFRKEWQVYQKLLDGDYMHHSSLYSNLQQYLEARIKGPYSLLDLGCGDSDYVSRMLSHSPQLASNLSHYVGVDMSQPAMAISATNLQRVLPPSARIQHIDSDMLSYARSQVKARSSGLTESGTTACPATQSPSTQSPQSTDQATGQSNPAGSSQSNESNKSAGSQPDGKFDVVLASFSLHHLCSREKEELLALVGQVLRPGGCFCLVDVFLEAGESRDDYLARFKRELDTFSSMDSLEQIRLFGHASECDFPEEVATYAAWVNAALAAPCISMLCERAQLYKAVAMELPAAC